MLSVEFFCLESVFILPSKNPNMKLTQGPNLVRLPPTGGQLNGQNQPIVTTKPAIRVPNTRK